MNQQLNQRCSGPVGRREFLKIGGLGLGALSGGLDPNLTRLLAGETQNARPNKDFSVILLWANGGPSHIDTFDMKPLAPTEYRGEFSPIKTNVPGIEICELLPNLAKMADKFSIVRSLHHNRNEHSGGTCRLLSGYTPTAANPGDAEYPEIGSVVASQLEHQVRDIPLFIANTKFYGGGPAYLGPAYSPFMFSGDPNSSKFSVDNLSVNQSAAVALKKRNQLLSQFDTFRRELDKSGSMAALDKFNNRALSMLTSDRTSQAFDLSAEPEELRDEYGRTTWGQGLLLARRLVESGVRLVQLQASFSLSKKAGRTSNWDDHSVNADIFQAYRERMPVFDQAVPALINDLHRRGLDQNVLFIFCGEFGRTPKVRHQDKKTKRPGRDHWCRAMSIFMAGGGLKMGQTIGATNPKGEHPVDRVMNSNDLLATIYQKFGIDTSQAFHDNTGRPIPILTDGQPIPELL
ncbi:MAG: hypothetical protein CME33_20085 [Gimesia sp.]|uniref:DUF1501 domain-containing protein n=2 Tax=Gimesia TaxID=1649453 RepID=UPI000C547F3B|nr:DUF1501 domain-containing protein [Gimesia sp.]MAX38861.1 hypothetical protein [Gimesia sp.]|tara:strand:- start:1479 stop:2861 length:1383 start_codon:yes stop_codon:yes gene_type:complete